MIVYLVAWTGGYDPASYKFSTDRADALDTFETWKGEAVDDDDSVIEMFSFEPVTNTVTDIASWKSY